MVLIQQGYKAYNILPPFTAEKKNRVLHGMLSSVDQAYPTQLTEVGDCTCLAIIPCFIFIGVLYTVLGEISVCREK